MHDGLAPACKHRRASLGLGRASTHMLRPSAKHSPLAVRAAQGLTQALPSLPLPMLPSFPTITMHKRATPCKVLNLSPRTQRQATTEADQRAGPFTSLALSTFASLTQRPPLPCSTPSRPLLPCCSCCAHHASKQVAFTHTQMLTHAPVIDIPLGCPGHAGHHMLQCFLQSLPSFSPLLALHPLPPFSSLLPLLPPCCWR